MNNCVLFTIGHSNRSWDDFISLLLRSDINVVVDVRRFPSSRLWPQFNKQNMAKELIKHDIRYMHIEKLGGRRKEKEDYYRLEQCNNNGWRNKSFRAYANYMSSTKFKEGIQELLSIKKVKDNDESIIAILCAEALPWQCHRRLISDYLTILNISVYNIINSSYKPSLHKLPYFAIIDNGQITYPS